MTYSPEPTTPGQIQAGPDECGQCGKDRCFCPPSDEEWAQAFAATRANVEALQPRDTEPLAYHSKGWSA